MGTAALTTRGFKESQIQEVADLIDRVLKCEGDEVKINAVRSDVVDLCKQFPMPH